MTQPFVLLLDHFDSFTYNLVQLLEVLGCKVQVVRTDQSFESLKDLRPTHVVLSPGPGHPKDAGLFLEAIGFWQGKLPILGVCLGHQAIALHAGAAVTRNFQQMHGKTSQVYHSGKGLFIGLPRDLMVCRYHSLVVEREEAERCGFDITASTGHNEVMAIESVRYRNLVGVQFHPESIFTEEGGKIIENFLKI